MSDAILYQSVLLKLGQLNPKELSQLDNFLSVLIGHNPSKKAELKLADNEKSAIYWLEQLSKIDGFSSIENPVEWQRNIRQDRKLPFR